MMSGRYVVGIDFGTDSVRSVIADARDGAAVAVTVVAYPRWGKGLYCDPVANRFRQHPRDYLETMETSLTEAVRRAGSEVASQIRGIAVDTTGSTPVLADGKGAPLALSPAFAEDPDAMFVLWKDHTAVAEAERINDLARSWGGTDFTRFEGGVYSSEWFWAKVLHVIEANPAVARAAVTILEHCDWIPAVLCGVDDLTRIKRSRCAAGHKAMWHPDFGGYPSGEFLARLNPRLPALKASLGTETFTSNLPFGSLAPAWAQKLGVPGDVVVAVGAFDAHMGAVGGNILPRRLLKVMGTSTCDMMVVPKSAGPEKLVAGICGQVDGSIIPGAIGYEAGQSAFGDVYAWFRQLLAWPLQMLLADDVRAQAVDRIIPALEKAAAALPPETAAVIALDWLNGRRTPDANQRLKGAIAGLSLGSDAPRIYRALVEATAFGSRAIVERFRAEGIPIDGVIGIGGVANKSPFAMQVLADVLDLTVEVRAGEQQVALGAAMFAATAAGLHPTVEDAQRAMSSGTEASYRPDPARARVYDALYREYQRLGAFIEKELT
jgi:L-ribulokinase